MFVTILLQTITILYHLFYRLTCVRFLRAWLEGGWGRGWGVPSAAWGAFISLLVSLRLLLQLLLIQRHPSVPGRDGPDGRHCHPPRSGLPHAPIQGSRAPPAARYPAAAPSQRTGEGSFIPLFWNIFVPYLHCFQNSVREVTRIQFQVSFFPGSLAGWTIFTFFNSKNTLGISANHLCGLQK